jgi:hypothetical protein
MAWKSHAFKLLLFKAFMPELLASVSEQGTSASKGER